MKKRLTKAKTPRKTSKVLHGTARNNTERKQVDEKVRVASAYTRGLIEASIDALVAISHEGKITDVNKATELLTGVSRDELIGSDFSGYFTDPAKATRGYEEAFTKGFVKDYSLAIRDKSGKYIDVQYNATVYRDETGEVQGVFAAARDITERKRLSEAVDVARQNMPRILYPLCVIRWWCWILT